MNVCVCVYVLVSALFLVPLIFILSMHLLHFIFIIESANSQTLFWIQFSVITLKAQPYLHTSSSNLTSKIFGIHTRNSALCSFIWFFSSCHARSSTGVLIYMYGMCFVRWCHFGHLFLALNHMCYHIFTYGIICFQFRRAWAIRDQFISILSWFACFWLFNRAHTHIHTFTNIHRSEGSIFVSILIYGDFLMVTTFFFRTSFTLSNYIVKREKKITIGKIHRSIFFRHRIKVKKKKF